MKIRMSIQYIYNLRYYNNVFQDITLSRSSYHRLKKDARSNLKEIDSLLLCDAQSFVRPEQVVAAHFYKLVAAFFF